jgi:hypothetical protein
MLSLLWATISSVGWLLATTKGAEQPTAHELVKGIVGNTLALGRLVLGAGVAYVVELSDRAAKVWAEAQNNPTKRELRAQRAAPRMVPEVISANEWTAPKCVGTGTENVGTEVKQD